MNKPNNPKDQHGANQATAEQRQGCQCHCLLSETCALGLAEQQLARQQASQRLPSFGSGLDPLSLRPR